MDEHSRILIADDDKYIRDDLKDLLSPFNGHLHFAATAKETWENVQTHSPNLVLLDIRFPDCSDLSLLSQIKTKAQATEVIILTSQTENVPLIVQAIKLGAF